mmetsp:Transcript_60490/g.128228  ORF Transcript_60490/g.128228 Transcript_60490/m.128228 type:complete len:509 (-) Transcript_60490:534-2060(-)|eukprot:CAMPEP_0206431976 /NCGR_PEP_ID=MMETSP0324_2-20121206/7659_1 /ASSEMBLY_ACC=CAM_ASM_000836 /TAXON_ID=2866 /ORGANISM="Crypthecodinium cohnii, Strain Seligo" /LENGTH=508 /DNA_ID=CAMNT_0053897955 /DNA_START=90 /DNA_END=1616 /DNA_ORIENTATION=+
MARGPVWRDAKKRWILVSGLMSFLLSIAMLYQMSPFFAKYAEATAGADSGSVGFIFAVLPFSAFAFSVPAAKFITRVGARMAMPVGLFFLAISSLLFGLSDSIFWWTIWRCLQGASASIVYSAVSVLFANAFSNPNDFAWVSSLQEAMSNLGFSIGPTMGGFLFQYGGFFAPFGVSAVGHLLFVGLSCYSPQSGGGGNTPKKKVTASSGSEAKGGSSNDIDEKEAPLLEECGSDDEPEVEHANMVDVMTREVMLVLPAGIIIPALFGALDPVFARHYDHCLGNISPGTTGTLIGVWAFPSVAMALAVPALMEKFTARVVMMIGIFGFVCVSSLLGLSDPSARDSIGWALPLEVGGYAQWALQVFLGLALGSSSIFGWTPVLPVMMEKAAEHVVRTQGVSTKIAMAIVSPAISALFNGAASIGEALGPILGGMLIKKMEFGGTFVLMGLMFAVYFAVLVAVPWKPATEHMSRTEMPSAPQLLRCVSSDLAGGHILAMKEGGATIHVEAV